MCGLFGWYATAPGAKLDLSYLQDIAIDTEQRGPHAFGFAWLDEDGKLHSYKQPGRISESYDELDRVLDATAVIGHCRWTTRGSESDNQNNHPHKIGRGLVVHNGRIPEYDEILRQRGFRVRSECDSEILGHLYSGGKGSILRRVRRAVLCTQSDIAILALWPGRRRLVAYADGKPLHIHGERRGVYFASLRSSLRSGKSLNGKTVTSLMDGEQGIEVDSLPC